MGRFFNPDNFLWRWFGRIGDFFFLSWAWLICSIPLVTIGASSIALYDAVAHGIHKNEPGMYRRFFRTFKRELGRGILVTLLWAALAMVLSAGYQILYQLAADDNFSAIMAIIYYVSLGIPIGWVCWVVAIESRFTNSFFSLHKNGLIFTFGHLPTTVAVVALALGCVELCSRFFFLVMVLPGLLVTLQAFFMERVLKKYEPAEEEVQAV